MADDTFAPGTLIAGKFRIVRSLGEGGMGSVWEIEHELTKHRRALKLLHSAMAAMPGIVERFLREASAAGRVGNSHIVETFDAGVLETGEPYLVMELLRGEPLSNRIQRGPLPLPEVVDLLGQACIGVAAAHALGRFDWVMFLSTFMLDEARHSEFFNIWHREVVGITEPAEKAAYWPLRQETVDPSGRFKTADGIASMRRDGRLNIDGDVAARAPATAGRADVDVHGGSH